jgi:hypothetical protein
MMSPDDPEADVSGDAACWLHLTCESCGALIEREGDAHRPGCELSIERTREREG